MAMEAEAAPLIERLGFSKVETDEPQLPFLAYETQFGELELSLVINGKDRRFGVESVGTQPATLATFWAIKRYNPELILNAGTCGAFISKGSDIADVYISESFRFHDRRISIPGYQAYGYGDYPAHTFTEMAEELGLKYATVSTGNSLDMCDTDMEIIDSLPVAVKEMEAAAIAWVAEQYGTPLVALKSVTDLVDGGKLAQEEFVENLGKASRALTEKTVSFLEALQKINAAETA
ncbi:5'-methylthioadenosine/S-adenosylhomocysteine nucleosidase [Fulvitalea axinellae]|uniref:5'-methylthioadenosine/S-adenosylhomocysteine nucleosidase n=2 Tax=Fulvitalea axinellae TaxID=1182444 RepID=A0AAU9CN69_9BACT|nr:5'-methylthioadenosine/S-adenosylhomocysteine nucleosidase [Fulvitalea axinellae]